jgi:hypothetical protein
MKKSIFKALVFTLFLFGTEKGISQNSDIEISDLNTTDELFKIKNTVTENNSVDFLKQFYVVSLVENISKNEELIFALNNVIKNDDFSCGELNNKKEKVSRVFISDENGIKKNSISSFDGDYFLNITLQAENFSNVEFGCTIFTEDGEALISSEILSDLSAVDGVCNAKIRLPHNLLTEGNYYLEGAMWRKGVGSIEQKDYYISIIVEPRNLIELEGGKVLGKLLNPNSWIKI